MNTLIISKDHGPGDHSEDIISESVSILGLNVRASTCLADAGISQVSQLIDLSGRDLLRFKNLGETTLRNIRMRLSEYGLSLKGDIPEFVDIPVSPTDLMPKPIAILKLPERASYSLTRSGILTVGQLVQKSGIELLRVRSFGTTTLDEVVRCLSKFGLYLGMEKVDHAVIKKEDLGVPISKLRVSKRLIRYFCELEIMTVEDFEDTDFHYLRTSIQQPSLQAEVVMLKNGLRVFGSRLESNLPRELFFSVDRLMVSKRAVSFFKAANIKYVGDLFKLCEEQLAGYPNVGLTTIEELRKLKESLNLSTDLYIPGWRSEAVENYVLRYLDEIETSFFDYFNRVYPIDSSRGLEFELRAALDVSLCNLGRRSKKDARNTEIVLDYIGLDSCELPTLEFVGDKYGVTRERVRQLVDAGLMRIAKLRPASSCFDSAFTFLNNLEFVNASKVSAQIKLRGLTKGKISCAALLRLAKHVGFDHSLKLEKISGEYYLGRNREFTDFRKIISVAKKLTTTNGCMTIDELKDVVLQEHSISSECLVFEAVCSVPGFAWLDDKRNWFWFDSLERNRLLNCMKKILTISKKIEIRELRAGLMRHHRMKGGAPPTRVLREIVCQVPGLECRHDIVIDSRELAVDDVIEGIEFDIYSIFSCGPSVMSFRALLDKCLSLGMNKNSAIIYILYSPIVRRIEKGLYSLIGKCIGPSDLADARLEVGVRTVGRVTRGHGMSEDGSRLWIVYKISAASLSGGVVSIPKAVSRWFSFDRYDLYDHERVMVGSLGVSKGVNLYGLSGFFDRRGSEEGDYVRLFVSIKEPEIVVELRSEPFEE